MLLIPSPQPLLICVCDLLSTERTSQAQGASSLHGERFLDSYVTQVQVYLDTKRWNVHPVPREVLIAITSVLKVPRHISRWCSFVII